MFLCSTADRNTQSNFEKWPKKHTLRTRLLMTNIQLSESIGRSMQRALSGAKKRWHVKYNITVSGHQHPLPQSSSIEAHKNTVNILGCAESIIKSKNESWNCSYRTIRRVDATVEYLCRFTFCYEIVLFFQETSLPVCIPWPFLDTERSIHVHL